MAVLLCVLGLGFSPAQAQGGGAATTADDLKAWGGAWSLQSSLGNGQEREEKELGLGREGTRLRVEGNQVWVRGRKEPIALATDVPLDRERKEVIEGNRLALFTLPTGTAVLASYRITGDKLEVRYPHTCHCTRSGVILSFERDKD